MASEENQWEGQVLDHDKFANFDDQKFVDEFAAHERIIWATLESHDGSTVKSSQSSDSAVDGDKQKKQASDDLWSEQL